MRMAGGTGHRARLKPRKFHAALRHPNKKAPREIKDQSVPIGFHSTPAYSASSMEW